MHHSALNYRKKDICKYKWNQRELLNILLSGLTGKCLHASYGWEFIHVKNNGNNRSTKQYIDCVVDREKNKNETKNKNNLEPVSVNQRCFSQSQALFFCQISYNCCFHLISTNVIVPMFDTVQRQALPLIMTDTILLNATFILSGTWVQLCWIVFSGMKGVNTIRVLSVETQPHAWFVTW